MERDKFFPFSPYFYSLFWQHFVFSHFHSFPFLCGVDLSHSKKGKNKENLKVNTRAISRKSQGMCDIQNYLLTTERISSYVYLCLIPTLLQGFEKWEKSHARKQWASGQRYEPSPLTWILQHSRWLFLSSPFTLFSCTVFCVNSPTLFLKGRQGSAATLSFAKGLPPACIYNFLCRHFWQQMANCQCWIQLLLRNVNDWGVGKGQHVFLNIRGENVDALAMPVKKNKLLL